MLPLVMNQYIYWAKVITQLCFILKISSSTCIIISPKRKFSQSSILLHNGFNCSRNKPFEKYEMNGDVPEPDMRQALHRKRVVDFLDFFRNSLHFKL